MQDSEGEGRFGLVEGLVLGLFFVFVFGFFVVCGCVFSFFLVLPFLPLPYVLLISWDVFPFLSCLLFGPTGEFSPQGSWTFL